MTDYYCGFCNNKFWNKSNLDKHQKTAKYCIAIQIKNKTNNKDTNIEVIDNNKLIERKVNDKREDKESSTPIREKQTIQKYKKTIEQLKIEIIDKQKKIEMLEVFYDQEKKRNEKNELEYKNKIKELETEIKNIHDKYIDKINVTNITNNNSTNTSTIVNRNKLIQNIIPLTNKCIKEQNSKMNIDDFKNHSISLAEFFHKNTLKDKLLISDKSRNILIYKDEFGNINRDEGGVKLCNMIINESRETILKYAIDYLKYLDSQPLMYKNDKYVKLCSLLDKLIKICQNENNPNNSLHFETFRKLFVNRLKELITVKENELDSSSLSIKNTDNLYISDISLDKNEREISSHIIDIKNEKIWSNENEDMTLVNIIIDTMEQKQDKQEYNFVITNVDTILPLIYKYREFLYNKAEGSSLQSEKKENSKELDQLDYVNSILHSLHNIIETTTLKDKYNTKEFLELYFNALSYLKLYKQEIIEKKYFTYQEIDLLLNENYIQKDEIKKDDYVYKTYKQIYYKG